MDFSVIFTLTDQPTTCPKCGARTDLIIDYSHTNIRGMVEECLGCGYGFLVVEEKT